MVARVAGQSGSRIGRMLSTLAALAAATLLAACSSEPTAFADGTNQFAAIDGDVTTSQGDWPNWGRDGSEQHYSPLGEINAENVSRLRLAWHYDLEPGFSASTPLMAAGRVYVTTGASHIRALDAVTGRQVWEFDAQTRNSPNPLHMGWGNKGIAYYNNRVFVATTDGRVIALDAATGNKLWEQRDYDVSEPRYTMGAPRVFGGRVIVGHGGADITPIRGYVTAYDANTGRRLWRFHTVPGNPAQPPEGRGEEIARQTWLGEWFGRGGGGTVWNAMSYDPQLNLVYLGVGNGFPYNAQLRSPGGGDNLFLASIVAVDATTGQYRWHYQTCPAEQWDCTATMDMTLADMNVGGRQRRVLMQAPKNGFFYVLDAATGEFLSAEPFARVTWATRIDPQTRRPVENPGIRYQNRPGTFELWPGPQGAHSWLPQAYSPRTNLVYIPVIEAGAIIGQLPPGDTGFLSRMGMLMIPDPDGLQGSRRSFLKAWDPVNQRAAWQVELPGDWPGGVLATAGDLVFQGRMDSNFVAYNARTGAAVWTFPTQAPVVGAPISYWANGRQYVTVITGNGSQGAGIFATGNAAFRTDYTLPRRVLTFVIDGTDRLPDFTPPPLVAPEDPDFRMNETALRAGAMAYATSGCLVCHGTNAIGGGAAPDLRYSGVIVNPEAFSGIVKGGQLRQQGMPGNPQIPDQALESIRYYLRARAQQTRSPQQAAPPAPPTPSRGG